jgi:cytosine deaminase
MESVHSLDNVGGRRIWTGDKLAEIQELERRLDALKTPTRMDFFMKQALLEGLVALHEGNYGIGAVITRRNQVIGQGHNRVFYPYYHSCHHAEMDAVERHETRLVAPGPRVDGCSLFTTLEPCPMCYTRILTSGIKNVYYAVEDEIAGMVTLMTHVKKSYRPLWQNLAESDGRKFELAPITQEARQLAWDMFACTRVELDADLVRRGGPFGDGDNYMMHGLSALHRAVHGREVVAGTDGVVRKGA